MAKWAMVLQIYPKWIMKSMGRYKLKSFKQVIRKIPIWRSIILVRWSNSMLVSLYRVWYGKGLREAIKNGDVAAVRKLLGEVFTGFISWVKFGSKTKLLILGRRFVNEYQLANLLRMTIITLTGCGCKLPWQAGIVFAASGSVLSLSHNHVSCEWILHLWIKKI